MTEKELLMPVIRAAQAHSNVADGDFIDAEGFVVCGKCKERKQSVVTFRNPENDEPVTYKVPSMCRCAQEKKAAAAAKEKAKEIAESLRNESLMGDRLRTATFENFEETPKNSRYLRICQRYAKNFDLMFAENQGLLFYGDVGTGKTYASACIANYLLESGTSVVMASFVKLVNDMQMYKGSSADIISKLTKPKLLILDDLGAERTNEYAKERVYDIIDSRYNSNRPVIFTTNLSLTYMQNTTDEKEKKIYDRIFQMCHPVQFEGTAYRKRDAAKRFSKMKEFLEG